MTDLKGGSNVIYRLIKQSFLVFWFSTFLNKLKVAFCESFIFNSVVNTEKVDSLVGGSLLGSVFRDAIGFVAHCGKFLKNSVILSIVSKNHRFLVYATVFLIPLVGTMPSVVMVCISIFSYVVNLAFNGKGESFFYKSGLGIVFLFITGFLVVSCISAFSSYTMAASVKIWALYFVFIVFAFVVCDLASRKGELINISHSFLGSLVISSLFGVYQQFFDSNIGHAWIDLEMFGTSSNRVYSTFGNPNVFGEYLILLIPVVFSLFLAAKNIPLKTFYLACCALSGVALIYTQSRGCWLAFVLAFALYLIFVDRRYLILMFILLLISPYIMPDFVIKRFMSIGNVQDTSTAYRVFIWLGTLNMLRDYWLYGVGLGSEAFSRVYTFYSYSAVSAPQAHNLYLQILSEMGIAGLGMFVSIVLFWFKDAVSAYFYSGKRKSDEVLLLLGFSAGILAFLIQGMFDYAWYNYRVVLIFWIVLALGTAAANTIIRRKPSDG